MPGDPTAHPAGTGPAAPAAPPGPPAAASIHLKTSLLVPGLHDERYPLPAEPTSVATLLGRIGAQMQLRLIGDDGELIDFLDVRLNGRKIDFHPERLATQLRPDDRLLVQLVPIGGG